jgi:quinoprotein glucose dehydrogenase
VDLVSGEILWKVPLGSTRDQAPFPLWLKLGVPSFGGGLATAGGLYFTGASMERRFRAFDVETGEELWSTRTPYAGNAAPMSFRLRPDSKQYVVIAAGGNPLTGTGDALLAFALRD